MSSRPVVASLPVTMPMRLPASCVTLSLLLSSLVVSSLESSSSLSLSLSLAVLAVFVDLAVFVAFAGFAGLAVLVALGVAAFLAGADAAAAAAAGVGVGAGAGTISAITFCRRMATTGQFGDLPTVVGTIARSALPLLKACALAVALSVVTTCNCSRSWLFANVLASTCTIFAPLGPVAIRISVFFVE